MKIKKSKKNPSGYVSVLTVFTTSILMLALMVYAYKRAIHAQAVQTDIQTQTDYREKEEIILRSIVAITPNRAIQAMQDGSDSSAENRNPLTFSAIYQEALEQSNARTSISAELLESLDLPGSIKGNTGDSPLSATSRIFTPLTENSGYTTGGLNRDLGDSFPPALNYNGSLTKDDDYPIISDLKQYGSNAADSTSVALSTDTYKAFNLIPYPQIDFGYANPGDLFVAKRNWWAFNMNLAGHDDSTTHLSRRARTFVLSIYEIPSQLPISASSFMALGQHSDGAAWQNVTISGNVFAGKALVEGSTALTSLSSRRGFDLSTDATIGGQSFTDNPFLPGAKETYRLTEGDFFPISQASESGKVVFIPINRGIDFFDRYAHSNETSTVSPTTWNNYSVGATQCAMTLDITRCASASDPTPTELKFTYLKNGSRQTMTLPLTTGAATNLPVGYIQTAVENETVNFLSPVDVAYGANGNYYFLTDVSGPVSFSNSIFGDPIVAVSKRGYFKPRYPFEVKNLADGKRCVAIYPERFRDFMALLDADDLQYNHSLAVNVDYINGANLSKPNYPTTDNDYGVILQECANLTSFTKGFSLVSNMRLYIGENFNVVPATTIPDGYTPAVGTNYYPPSSLFAPEKRYGVGLDPFAVRFTGQVGSAASEDASSPVRPLETKVSSGSSMSANKITMNLSTISHPAELPPITMKNWLIIMEEKRREFDP